MKIYIASAMFTDSRKKYINRVAKIMRQLGHEVYVPHEHTIEGGKQMPNKIWASEVFKADVEAIKESDAIYYICEGMDGDIGSAWECGFGYALGKRIMVDEYYAENDEYFDPCISLMVAQCTETEFETYQS